jgi:hypothetical protein
VGEQFPIAFGRYELVERLAAGGMAELFVATVAGEHGFAKKVVIKRLLPNLAQDPSYTQMFIDEAKLTARLVHPKIAQTYELGRVGDELFIAMEYVDGFDVLAMLRECAGRREQLEHHLAAWIIREVLDALDFAHQASPDDQGAVGAGVVHRDISPSNILLSTRGDVKLIDFGIAHEAGREATKTGTLKGKYGYMSPEQVLEEPLDHRSDLFSVGVVLAEMLTGRRLFAANNELDVLLMVRDARLTRLDKYGDHIDPGLDVVVRTALKKDVGDRWQSAAAFRDAIDEWLFMQRRRVSAKMVADLVATLRPGVLAQRASELVGAVAAAAPQASSEPAPATVGPAPSEPAIELAELELGGAVDELDLGLSSARRADGPRPDAVRTTAERAASASSGQIDLPESRPAPLPIAVGRAMTMSTLAPSAPRADARARPAPAPKRQGASMVIKIPTADATEPAALTPSPLLTAPAPVPSATIDEADFSSLSLDDAPAPPAATSSRPDHRVEPRPEPLAAAPAGSGVTPISRTRSVEQIVVPRSITPPAMPGGATLGRVPTPPRVARVPTGQPAPLISSRAPTPERAAARTTTGGGIGARASYAARTSTGGGADPAAARTASGTPGEPLVARTSSASAPRVARTATPVGAPVEPAVARTATPTPSARTKTGKDARRGADAATSRTATGAHGPAVARSATFDADLLGQPAAELDLFGAELAELELDPSANFPSIEKAIESLMPPRAATPPPVSLDASALTDDGDESPFGDPDASGILQQQPSRPVGEFGGLADNAGEEPRAERPGRASIPPPAEPVGAKANLTGDFAETPPLTVLFRLMTDRATGMLAVEIGDIKKEIFFRDGQPEYVSSNVASELFGSYLVSKGVMSDGELAMALAMMPHYGGKLGDTLVGLGLLKPLDVFRHLTRQVRSKLIDVCTWSKGTFAWWEGRENNADAFPLDLNTYEVLGAGAMALPIDTLDLWIERRRLARPLSQRSARVGPERFEIYRLADVFESLDGQRTVAQILDATNDKIERTRTARLLYLLESVELARLG